MFMPLAFRFDQASGAYTFRAAVNDQLLTCFVTQEAAKLLAGKHETQDEYVNALQDDTRLIRYVLLRLTRGAVDPIWLSIDALRELDDAVD